MLTLSIHIAFVGVWAASLVYFPYLFSEQSQAEDRERHDRLVLLQRWIYAIVMTPSALIAVVAGTWLALERGFAGGWLQVKLAIVRYRMDRPPEPARGLLPISRLGKRRLLVSDGCRNGGGPVAADRQS